MTNEIKDTMKKIESEINGLDDLALKSIELNLEEI